MILPIFEVQELIESMSFADVVFVTSIDEEYLENVTSTVVLVTETVNDLDKRANNRFRNMNYGVEVQIFYGINFTKPILDTEISLARLLEKKIGKQPNLNHILMTRRLIKSLRSFILKKIIFWRINSWQHKVLLPHISD